MKVLNCDLSSSSFLSILIALVVTFSGIADGVGGWRRYDVDPSKFTRSLMNNCERIARSTTTDVLNPVGLLQRAYEQMMHLKSPLLGMRK